MINQVRAVNAYLGKRFRLIFDNLVHHLSICFSHLSVFRSIHCSFLPNYRVKKGLTRDIICVHGMI